MLCGTGDSRGRDTGSKAGCPCFNLASAWEPGWPWTHIDGVKIHLYHPLVAPGLAARKAALNLEGQGWLYHHSLGFKKELRRALQRDYGIFKELWLISRMELCFQLLSSAQLRENNQLGIFEAIPLCMMLMSLAF